MNQSEVARLRAQIEQEAQASRSALYGLSSGSSRHEVITAHMERMGALAEELMPLLGNTETIRLVIAAMDGSTQKDAQKSPTTR